MTLSKDRTFTYTVNNLEFSRNLTLYALKTKATVKSAFRAFAGKITTKLIIATPRLTGRARAGFIPAALGLRAAWAGLVYGPGVTQGRKEGSWGLKEENRGNKITITIENKVPYILRLATDSPSYSRRAETKYAEKIVARSQAELNRDVAKAIKKWW